MSDPAIQIRRATETDAERLAELYVAYFDEHRQWYAFSPPRERYQGIFDGYWANRTQHYFVATCGGEIAGFMRCALHPTPAGADALRPPHGGRRERVSDAKRALRNTLSTLRGRLPGASTPSDEPIVASVNDFFVASAFRKQGIAVQLLDAGRAWFREQNAEHVVLEVMANNENAIGFYERYGFSTERRMMRLPLVDPAD